MIAITPIADLFSQLGHIVGYISKIFTKIQLKLNYIQTIYGNVIGMFNTALAQLAGILNKMRFMALIAFIIAIGKCFFKWLGSIVAFWKWVFDFLVWLFKPWPDPGLFDFKTQRNVTAGFVPWGIRFIMCTAYKVISFPKCFMWYGLDIAGWIFYLPFRFLFWLVDSILDIGLVKLEKDTWCFLNDLDYFLHGPADNYFMYQYAKEDSNAPIPDPESLNTGYHFIHFPDSVMEKCYALNYYKLQNAPNFPVDEIMAAFKCALNPMDWDSSTNI
jgi:hypothetical protein